MRSKRLWVCLLMFGVALTAYSSEFLQKKEMALKNAEQADKDRDYTLEKLYEAEASAWGGADEVKDESRALRDLFVRAAELRIAAEKSHLSARSHQKKVDELKREISNLEYEFRKKESEIYCATSDAKRAADKAESAQKRGRTDLALKYRQTRVSEIQKKTTATTEKNTIQNKLNLTRPRLEREVAARDAAYKKRDELDVQATELKDELLQEIRLLAERKNDYYTPRIKAKVCYEIAGHQSQLAKKYSVDPIKRDYFSQKAGFYQSVARKFSYGCEELSLEVDASGKRFFELTYEKFGSEARGLIQKYFPRKERSFVDQLIPERFTEARYKDHLRKKDIKVKSSDFELPHIRQQLEMAGKKVSGINQKVSLYLGGCVGLCDQLDQLLREGATTRFFYEAKPRVLETLDLYYDYPAIRKEIADNCEKYYIDQKKADQCAEKVAEIQKEIMGIRFWTLGKADKIAAVRKRIVVFHKLERAFHRGDVEDMYEALRQAKESELLREDKYFIAKLIPSPILDFSIPAELMKLLDISKQQERKIFKAVYGFELYFPNDDVVYYEEEEER